MKRLLSVTGFLCFILPSLAYQETPDSLPRSESVGGKPYAKVIGQATTQKSGLITIDQTGEKYYFEIPPSLLGKEILAVTRVAQGTALGRVYPGDEIDNHIFHFERSAAGKMVIREDYSADYATDSVRGMYQAVRRNNLMPIIAVFPIATINERTNAYVIDATDFILSDNRFFSFDGNEKGALNIAELEKEKSYISELTTFPQNIEIKTIKTYTTLAKGRYGSVKSSRTFELNTSFVLLPEISMAQRLEDKRVGYFSIKKNDYDRNPNGIEVRSYVRRWRLEPKTGDIQKYLAGELVEPKKQIVFYIDPATPKKWIPYLIQGVNDWNKAFEQAGFKNAIVGKTAPSKSEDSSWSPFDSRHSAIIYKPSPIENAAGYTIADPRTGEILESHISWYHNLLHLLHEKYFLSCAAVDTAARSLVFPDTLMGKLVRYAIAHEVGHALGLLHNMGASSTVSVDSLRNKTWVEKNSLCPSIMDYARFNYVAQPEDNISQEGLIARVGAYDRWAIEWGYKWFPSFDNPEAEQRYLAKETGKRLQDHRLWYGPQTNGHDPRSQANDLGDDAISASKYGIRNLKRILPFLVQWVTRSGGNYNDLDDLYTDFQQAYTLYLGHVAENIGGTYQTLKNMDQPGPVYSPVDKKYQKKAMAFMADNGAQPQTWMADREILSLTGQSALGVIGNINDEVAWQLIGSPLIFYKLLSRNESNWPGTYTTIEYLKDLKKNIWTELYTHQPINIFRRSLQERYLKYVFEYVRDDNMAFKQEMSLTETSDIMLYAAQALEMLQGQLYDIQNMAKKNLLVVKDEATRYHLQYVINQIDRLSYSQVKK